MQAHTALTQYYRARRAAEQAGGDLAGIANVVSNLVTLPGRGRRAQVEALNRASIVLLSAHLQGYIDDVYAEAAHALLNTKIRDVDALVERARKSFRNPRSEAIDQLFCSIGVSKVLDSISWRKASNSTVKQRLAAYVKLRNRIAHGEEESVKKEKVEGFRRFVELFAQKFDAKVHDELQNTTGTSPW